MSVQSNPTLKILTVNGQRYRADTGELVTLEELQSEGWKLATPRIAKSLIERGIVKVTSPNSIRAKVIKAGLPPSGGVTGSAPTDSSEPTQKVNKSPSSNLFLSEKVARAPVDRLKGITKPNGQGTKSWTPGSVMDWVERLSVENSGLVPLWKLGQKLGCSPQALHSAIQELRRRGRLTASAFEGRQGIREAERRWLLDDGHEQVGYVSIKSVGVVKGKGEPCKRGETAAKDECIPTSRQGEFGSKTGQGETESGDSPDIPRNPPRMRQESSGSKMRGVGRFVVRTFLGAISAYQNLKTTGVRFRDVGYDKLPPKAQRKLSRIWAAVKYIEHKIMTGFTKGRQLAEEAARERGLPIEHVERLGRVLATIDVISAWTVNVPATLAVTGSMTTAKMASWIPVASLSYVAYSTAKNPFATIRAAKAVIKKSRKTKDSSYMVTKEFLDNKQLSEALADGMKEAGDNVEWYLALVSSALDETPDDVLGAIKVASEAFKRDPAPQDEDYAISEEDIEGIDLDEGEDVTNRPVNRLGK